MRSPQGFEYDLFVSYAHADNEALDSVQPGWVTQFARALRVALRQRLGGREPTIFFDHSALRTNQQLDAMLRAAGRSRLFLAVSSPAYAGQDWTRLELDAFMRSTAEQGTAGLSEWDTSRLFVAECLPLSEGEEYPRPLGTHIRKAFFASGEHEEVTVPLAASGNSAEVFRQKVMRLAIDMRDRLRSFDSPEAASVPAPQPAYQAIPVLLAQVTDDLEGRRDELRGYLQQHGIPVLPAEEFPQGADEFRIAFEECLSRAGLVVQLLGPYSGRVPRGLGQSYTAYQATVAASGGRPLLQWRPPELDPSQLPTSSYSELLAGQSVVTGSFEEFKAVVLRRAVITAAPPSPEHGRAAAVFINAADEDMPIARGLQGELARRLPAERGPQIYVPAQGASAEQLREDLEGNLVECDALVLVYGHASPVWVRGQLRLFSKLRPKRRAPPRVLAIYTAPPPEKPKLGVAMPELLEIDARTASGPDLAGILVQRLASA